MYRNRSDHWLIASSWGPIGIYIECGQVCKNQANGGGQIPPRPVEVGHMLHHVFDDGSDVHVRSIWRLHTVGCRIPDYFRAVLPTRSRLRGTSCNPLRWRRRVRLLSSQAKANTPTHFIPPTETPADWRVHFFAWSPADTSLTVYIVNAFSSSFNWSINALKNRSLTMAVPQTSSLLRYTPANHILLVATNSGTASTSTC